MRWWWWTAAGCWEGEALARDSTERFPAPLVRFAELFNAGEFWESHEVLEDPWREHGSAFYQGLILYASAFVHVRRDNAHGIRAQLRKARQVLAPYEPAYLGVDTATVRRHAREVIQLVEDAGDAPPTHWEDRITFPRLELRPELVRGSEPELAD